MLKKRINNQSGLTALELLIVMALMSIVALPAYMALSNGFVFLHDESRYQEVISDVQLAYEEINTRNRLEGFRNSEVIMSQEKLNEFEGIRDEIHSFKSNILRVGDTFYYYEANALMKYRDSTTTTLVEYVVSFSPYEPEDKTIIEIETTISVDGRQEKISTSIYDRY